MSKNLTLEVNFRTLLFKTIISLIMIFLNLSINTHAREHNIRFQRISIEDGLSQSDVYCILQDSKGFMWFGTEDGLNKYDGYSFKVYRNDPGNPYSLSYSDVKAIYEDKSGVLWIGTEGGGLNKFDREKERFIQYETKPNNPFSLSNNYVYSIYEDQSGVLWIGTDGRGLNKLIPGVQEGSPPTFIHYKANPSSSYGLSHNKVRSIYEDRSGVLWIGTYGGGLNKLVPGAQEGSPPTFIHYKTDPNDPHSLSNNRVMSIYEDRSGVLWVGTDGGGVNRLVPGANEGSPPTFIHYKANPSSSYGLSHNKVRSIYEDRSGVLWIGTYGGGLNKLVPDAKEESPPTFIHYKTDPNDPHSLSNNRIMSIYEDRSGVLWVGTDIGLNKFDQGKKQFLLYQNKPNDPNSLSNNFVRPIYEDRSGILWIGTYGSGLDRFDRKRGQFTNYRHNPDDPHSLSNNLVRSIYEDKSAALWIGTESGLNKFDRKKERFIRYKANPNDPNSLSNDLVYSICEDRSSILWIGTAGGGLNRLVPGTNNLSPPTFIHYKADPNNPHSLSHNFIYCIYEDKSGVLWVGTFGGGLNKIVQGPDEKSRPTFAHYKNDLNDPKSLSNNIVISIYEDKSGVLWIGTAGGGLDKLVPDAEEGSPPTFIHYREKDGLPNNKIYGILEDERGNLWLSHNKGLSKFDPHTETFRNYDVSDGLQSSEFNGGSYHKSRSGEMFFGGINGLNSFYPSTIRDNPYIPPVVITNFQIFNKSILPGKGSDGRLILKKSITEAREIELTYKDRVVSFEFAALHYASPDKNQYGYRLEGVDKDWNHVGNRRFATYTNIHPGDYTFRVKGSNNDGVWNEEGISLKITVTPPFWQTWWFRASSIIAVLLVIFSVYQVRTHNIRARTKQLGELVNERTNELTAANRELRQEIAERKQAEKEIEKRQLYLESILDSTPDAIVTTDSSHNIIEWNRGAERIFGHTRKNVLGKNLNDTVTGPDVIEEAAALTKQVLSGEKVPPLETVRYKKDGSAVNVILAGSPVKIGNELHGVMVVYTDITELKSVEAQYRSLFEGMPIGLYRTTPKGKILDANSALAKMLGFKNREDYLVHGRVDGYVNPDERQLWQYLMEHEGVVSGFEVKWQTRDGKVIWVRENARIVRDSRGKVLYYEGAAEDITESKRAEEEIEKRQQYLESVLENAPDAIVTYDTSHRITEWNQGAEKIFGYVRKEVLGKNIDDVVAGPDVMKEAKDLTKKALSGERDPSHEAIRYRKNGMPVNVILAGSPIKIGDKLHGVVAVYTDITELKRTERALKESEKKYRTLFNRVADPVFIFDRDTHRFLDCNQAVRRIYGYSIDELRSMTLFDLHPPEDLELVKRNIDVRNVSQPFTYTHLTKDGRGMSVETRSDETDYQGRPAWISIVRDITEQKMLENQLKDFAYIVSHDLKAPLRAINQLATWISEDYADAFDGDGREQLNLLIGRVKRMDNLINGILQYSRAGRGKGKEEEVDLNTAIREVIESITPADNIQILIENKLPVVSADPVRIEQVFQNLISNAVKYMDKPKGEIKIGCVDEGSHWRFSVADNGPGIDEKYHDKIFQIFQTLEPRDKQESTGVGLSVVKRIVELYEGKIWVESKVEKGSTFFFTLKKGGGKNEK